MTAGMPIVEGKGPVSGLSGFEAQGFGHTQGRKAANEQGPRARGPDHGTKGGTR